MLGTETEKGCMSRAVSDLFEEVGNNQNASYVVKISYIEIYNEVIKDLLVESEKVLDIREDPIKGVVVAGVAEVITTSASEVMDMLFIGNRNRTVEPTMVNQESSRSHAIL